MTRFWIFRILLLIAIIDLVNGIYFVIFPLGISHPFQYNGLGQQIIVSGLWSLLLTVIMIVLCRLKWRLTFIYVLIIYLHFLGSKLPIIGYPIIAVFNSVASFQFITEVIIAVLGSLVSLVGIIYSGKMKLKK